MSNVVEPESLAQYTAEVLHRLVVVLVIHSFVEYCTAVQYCSPVANYIDLSCTWHDRTVVDDGAHRVVDSALVLTLMAYFDYCGRRHSVVVHCVGTMGCLLDHDIADHNKVDVHKKDIDKQDHWQPGQVRSQKKRSDTQRLPYDHLLQCSIDYDVLQVADLSQYIVDLLHR